jgi:hypothetical protein
MWKETYLRDILRRYIIQLKIQIGFHSSFDGNQMFMELSSEVSAQIKNIKASLGLALTVDGFNVNIGM